MPDQQGSDHGIASNRLMDVLGLLGAGGLSKGVLVSPGALRSLGGAKSMHPATAKTLGWDRPLSSPESIMEQRMYDNEIMDNYRKLVTQQLYQPMHRWPDVYKYGWQFGPKTGLSRELPDIGTDIRGNTYIHPEGDILGLHSIDKRIRWDDLYNKKGAMGEHDDLNSPQTITLDDSLINPFSVRKNLIRKNLDLGDEFPYARYPAAIASHETQHGIQGSRNFMSDYNYQLPWIARPHEWEARGVENRALLPKAYEYPFHQTAQYTSWYDLLDKLKKDPQSLQGR